MFCVLKKYRYSGKIKSQRESKTKSNNHTKRKGFEL